MELSNRQMLQFHEEGYLVIPGAVSRLMVETARQAINHEMGRGEANPFPRINSTPVITDLFNQSPAFPLLESALGIGNLLPCKTGAIKLNYPRPLTAGSGNNYSREIGWGRPGGGHLDGIKAVGDRLRGLREDGTYRRNFTAFAVVYLNDMLEPDAGNFTVWPGSHHYFEDYFKEHGHKVLDDHMPHVEMPIDPVQTTGEAGDLVLAHHMLVHTGSSGSSPNIRYAIIFRPQHVDLVRIGFDAFTDIWIEWDGIREAVSQNEALMKES